MSYRWNLRKIMAPAATCSPPQTWFPCRRTAVFIFHAKSLPFGDRDTTAAEPGRIGRVVRHPGRRRRELIENIETNTQVAKNAGGAAAAAAPQSGPRTVIRRPKVL